MGNCKSKGKGSETASAAASASEKEAAPLDTAAPDPDSKAAPATASALAPAAAGPDASAGGGPVGVSAAFLRMFAEKHELPVEMTSGETAGAAGPTTTEVCRDVILPATAATRGALVELYAGDAALVGAATVFVSHAWRYPFAAAVSAMLALDERARAAGEAPPFFWFDLFVNNQNDTAAKPQEFWTTTFQDSIKHIGHVLLVLHPWADPIPMTRAWCLFEIQSAMHQQVRLDIALPPSERHAFHAALAQDFDAVLDMLVRVQAERAEAFLPADKEMIFARIEELPGGFVALNERVKTQLRLWCLNTAVALLEDGSRAGEAPAVAADPQARAGLCFNVGTVMRKFGRSDAALQYLEEARRLQTAHGGSPVQVADCDIGLGLVYKELGQLTKAQEHLQAALVGFQAELGALGPEQPAGGADEAQDDREQAAKRTMLTRSKAAALANLGTVHFARGELAAARDKLKASLHIFNEELRLSERQMGADVAGIYNNLGNVDAMENRFADAQKSYELAVAIYKQALGLEHPATGEALKNLGNALLSQGNFAEAEVAYSAALNVFLSTFGRGSLPIADMLNNLAALHFAKEDFAAAEEKYQGALKIREAALPPDHPSIGEVLLNIGLAQARLQRWVDAEAAVARAQPMLLAGLGPGHPKTAQATQMLAAIKEEAAKSASASDRG